MVIVLNRGNFIFLYWLRIINLLFEKCITNLLEIQSFRPNLQNKILTVKRKLIFLMDQS